jgi:hypothetical protein
MSQEEKNAKNQRRREARQEKKVLDALHISGATVKLRKESGHWMHYMLLFLSFLLSFCSCSVHVVVWK